MKTGEHGFDYDALRDEYPAVRRTDPRIAGHINTALGEARTLLNVGAGTGSYEPDERYVVALEPSARMRSRRSQARVPAIDGTAEKLPFDDGAFESAMALLTVHHWPDLERGLSELRRVATGPVVVMTFDPFAPTDFWMGEYAPELCDVDRARYGALERVRKGLGGEVSAVSIDVPGDCLDCFQVALYARPELFLEKRVRDAQSAWSHLPEGVESRVVSELRADLESGAWDDRFGHLRQQPTLPCQLRLVVSRPAKRLAQEV